MKLPLMAASGQPAAAAKGVATSTGAPLGAQGGTPAGSGASFGAQLRAALGGRPAGPGAEPLADAPANSAGDPGVPMGAAGDAAAPDNVAQAPVNAAVPADPAAMQFWAATLQQVGSVSAAAVQANPVSAGVDGARQVQAMAGDGAVSAAPSGAQPMGELPFGAQPTSATAATAAADVAVADGSGAAVPAAMGADVDVAAPAVPAGVPVVVQDSGNSAGKPAPMAQSQMAASNPTPGSPAAGEPQDDPVQDGLVQDGGKAKPGTTVTGPATAPAAPATAAVLPGSAVPGAAIPGAADTPLTPAAQEPGTAKQASTAAVVDGLGAAPQAAPNDPAGLPREASAAVVGAPANPGNLALPAAPVPVQAPLVSAAPAAPGAAPLAEQLARPLFTLAGAPLGEHVMTVNVVPEGLGPVTVRAHLAADGIRIELVSATDAGRDSLRTMLSDLKRDLAAGGMASTVSLGAGTGGQEPGPGQQRGHAGPAHPWAAGRGEPPAPAEQRNAPAPAGANRSLDITV